MAFFKKSEDYEDEEEFDEEAEIGQKRFTRKIKDLKPANRKRRKEPPKPWGKKERLIIFAILALTVLASVILTLTNGRIKSLKLSIPKINLNSLNIFKEETIIIQKN